MGGFCLNKDGRGSIVEYKFEGERKVKKYSVEKQWRGNIVVVKTGQYTHPSGEKQWLGLVFRSRCFLSSQRGYRRGSVSSDRVLVGLLLNGDRNLAKLRAVLSMWFVIRPIGEGGVEFYQESLRIEQILWEDLRVLNTWSWEDWWSMNRRAMASECICRNNYYSFQMWNSSLLDVK